MVVSMLWGSLRRRLEEGTGWEAGGDEQIFLQTLGEQYGPADGIGARIRPLGSLQRQRLARGGWDGQGLNDRLGHVGPCDVAVEHIPGGNL